jgi:probable F420-dependent oxidoreductase
MRYGITMFATDRQMPLGELAVAAEERGFDSVWVPEHTHIPTSRNTPPPGGEAELPEYYSHTLDPLVALAHAAALTSTIRLGTGVMLPAQREPLVTAKAIATLDRLSHGRIDLGIGFGWNQDEIEHHGIAFADRRAVCREHVAAMRALWSHDEAEYHGEFVRFEPSWSWPKPVGSLPILIGGGAGPKLFEALVDYADGWIPVGGAGLTEAIPRLHQQLEAAGRDSTDFRIVPFGSLPDAAKLEHFRRIGVTECVLRVHEAPRDDVLRVLDEQAALVTSLRAG